MADSMVVIAGNPQARCDSPNGILAEAKANVTVLSTDQCPYLLVFSAHNEVTLRANVGAISNNMAKYKVRDLAHTLACRRSLLAVKSFAIASEMSLKTGIELKLQSPRRIAKAIVPIIAFLFTGEAHAF